MLLGQGEVERDEGVQEGKVKSISGGMQGRIGLRQER